MKLNNPYKILYKCKIELQKPNKNKINMNHDLRL